MLEDRLSVRRLTLSCVLWLSQAFLLLLFSSIDVSRKRNPRFWRPRLCDDSR